MAESIQLDAGLLNFRGLESLDGAEAVSGMHIRKEHWHHDRSLSSAEAPGSPPFLPAEDENRWGTPRKTCVDGSPKA